MKRHVPEWVKLFYGDNTLHCFQCHERLTPAETDEFVGRTGMTIEWLHAADADKQAHPWRLRFALVVRWFRVTFIRPRCETIL